MYLRRSVTTRVSTRAPEWSIPVTTLESRGSSGSAPGPGRVSPRSAQRYANLTDDVRSLSAPVVAERPHRVANDLVQRCTSDVDTVRLFYSSQVVEIARASLLMLIGLPLLAMVSAVAFSLLMPRLYTIQARFIPESNQPQGSRLAGLAAQLGVDVPGMEGSASVDFYAELLKSTELLRSAVLTEYSFEDEDGNAIAGDLVELLEADGKTTDGRVRAAVEKLDELVVARVDPNAEIVTVETSDQWSAVMTERLLTRQW